MFCLRIAQKRSLLHHQMLFGKNIRFDKHSPEKHDHINLLIVNKLRWSTKTGGRWSDDPFCPAMRLTSPLSMNFIN